MASKREQIKMKSEESAFHYFTRKNKSSTPNRLELKKYDPVARKHGQIQRNEIAGSRGSSLKLEPIDVNPT